MYFWLTSAIRPFENGMGVGGIDNLKTSLFEDLCKQRRTAKTRRLYFNPVQIGVFSTSFLQQVQQVAILERLFRSQYLGTRKIQIKLYVNRTPTY